jgi:hypothetical protein
MKSRLLVLNTPFAIMYTWYRLGWAGLGWIGWLVTKTSTNAKLGLSYLKLNIHGEKIYVRIRSVIPGQTRIDGDWGRFIPSQAS